MPSAALLGFALSIDDFVITYLNAGGEQTFPVFVWGIARRGAAPGERRRERHLPRRDRIALGNVFWQIRRQRQGAA